MNALRAMPPPVKQQQTRPLRSLPAIRRVLASVSLSSRNSAVAAEASLIARTFGAELQLIHVRSGQEIPSFAPMLAEVGLDPDTPVIVRTGRPDRVICQTARDICADLIVAGILRKESTLAEHARTVAGRLVVSAPCHVLLVRHPRIDPLPPRRFVAAVGLDPISHAMLDWMIPWARGTKAESFEVVHEYDPRGFYSLAEPQDQPIYDEAERERVLTDMLDGFDWTGLHRSQICLRTNTGCDALWYANVTGADLLCIPVTPRRVTFWRRLIDHGLAVDLHALPCSTLFFKP